MRFVRVNDPAAAPKNVQAILAGSATVIVLGDDEYAATPSTAFSDALTDLGAGGTGGLDQSDLDAAIAALSSVYQPLDADLTAVAALSPSNDDVLQRKAAAWTNRTIAQLLVDLAAPGTTFQPLDADLTAIAAVGTAAYGRALLALANAAAGDWITKALVDVKGDLIAATADDTPARLAVGANDALLTAASGQATGLQWVQPLKQVSILVTDPNGVAITTGDGKAYWRVPASLGGMDLVAVGAHVTTVSSSGLPTVQIANVTQAADMLTTKLTIDANEKDSSTAATPAVIDTGNDDVATGDELRIDIDVAGTGAKGLIVDLAFRLP